MTPAVVLAADSNGLGAVRALAAAGIPVTAIVTSATDVVCSSRYGQHVVVAGDDDAGLAAALDAARGGLVIPTTDEFALFLVRRRAELEPHFTLCIPSDDIVRASEDKGQQYASVSALPVSVPRTLADLSDGSAAVGRELGFPLVLKPRSSKLTRAFRIKARVVTTPDELAAFFESHREKLSGLIAQEFVPGGEDRQWVCDCVFDDASNLVSAFTFQKLHTAPADNGVTSVGVSRRNPAILAAVETVGRGLGYVGPADFDFKLDDRDGVYKFIEMNPRVGMCNGFAARCGVHVVLDTYRVFAGLPVQPADQREDVLYVSAFDDLYTRVKRKERLRGIAKDYVGYLASPTVGPYFSFADPVPAIRVGFAQISQVVRSCLRRH